MAMRVIAAMSGGVDSSVAAARLVDAGHEVVGVHLALSRAESVPGSRGCCTLDDARDARRVADMLGIPFYVWDFSAEFAELVIDDFISEYDRGRTPNPCVRCNERIKFSAVMDRALAMGFDAVATGHYARIIDGPGGRELHRAADPEKDQSYVLAVIERWRLDHALFPLGDDVKDAVRDEAERRGLLVARKPDSHDICFIPDGDTAGFLARRLGERPGAIVDAGSGEPLGAHLGSYGFTIGQRRGLGLTVPAADGAPRYVVDVDIDTGRVLVGAPELLDVDAIDARRTIWVGDALDEAWTPVRAQMRAHGQALAARARVLGDLLRVELATPIRGLAAGQTIALYDGDRVLGSATIDRTHRVADRQPA